MPRDVFISYRSEDKVWAERLCDQLEKQNITCWLAPRDIAGGREWAEAIVEALQHCRSFVLVLSSNSSNARQISREAELADRQGLPIITFRVEDVQPPPGLLYFLGNLQWLDAFGDQFDPAVARLAAVVGKTSVADAAVPRPLTPVAPQAAPLVAPPVAAHATPPVAPPSATPAAPAGLSPRTILIGIAAVVVLILVGWLILRQKPAPAPSVSEADARAEAQKYLNDLKDSNYDEAWNQFNATGRASQPKARMERTWNAANQKYGPIQDFRFKRCTMDDPSGIFTCLFELQYRDGATAEGTYVVARDSSGAWGISKSSHSEPKPKQ